MAEMNTELNEQEKMAAEAAVNQTVPAAAPEAPAVPEKKLFAKGSKSRKVAKGIGFGILGTILAGVIGTVIFKAGESSGEKKASGGDVIDADYSDITDTPADDTAPFDEDSTNSF